MQIHNIFLSAVLLSLLSGEAIAFGAKKSDYQVGERLPQNFSIAKSSYKEITWDDLMPKDWDPMKDFKKLKLDKLKDSDPRAQEALQQLRETWNNAPVEPLLGGLRIRIAGFIVPLEESHHQISEFLLVPFFGGCIHVPPPPANQIIHVFPAKPLKGLQIMDAVFIGGPLEVFPSDTSMGSAGYRMKAEVVEPYKN